MEQKTKLLNLGRAVAEARHLRHQTKYADHNFIERDIIFHAKAHPEVMEADEITEIYPDVQKNKSYVKSRFDLSKAVKLLYALNYFFLPLVAIGGRPNVAKQNNESRMGK